MLVGLDFDNTIVCYDNAIKILSESIPDLPLDLPRTKISLRNFLRQKNREFEWTKFQGELYGPGMRFAEPFSNAITAMKTLIGSGHDLVIVSHRSKRPYAGEPYDLHYFAQQWITSNLRAEGLFADDLGRPSVYFLESKIQKICMISSLNCNAFVDDLPEIFLDKNFPLGVRMFLLILKMSLLEIQIVLLLLDDWNDLPGYFPCF